MRDAELLLGALGVLGVFLAVVLFWRVLRALLGFALRALLGGGALAALGSVPLGLHLGVNAFNLCVVGLLGAPGLGLLLLLDRLLW